jgi:hypothetical protein
VPPRPLDSTAANTPQISPISDCPPDFLRIVACGGE